MSVTTLAVERNFKGLKEVACTSHKRTRNHSEIFQCRGTRLWSGGVLLKAVGGLHYHYAKQKED